MKSHKRSSYQLPTISLITPSYNQGRFLRQSIQSVLNQGYPKLEYLVMDGGSTDDSVAILRSFGSRLRWVSKRDGGQTQAINLGLKRTSGEIVGYLNSDDVLTPGALWKVALSFAQHPESAWLTGGYRIIDKDNREIESHINMYKYWQRTLASTCPSLWPIVMGINNPLIQPSTFWRRSAQEIIGTFNESYRYVMDYDFWLRLFAIGNPTIVSEALSLFRVHSESKGGAQFKRQFAEQLSCARSHGVHETLLALQKRHNQLICWAYSRR